MNSALQELLPRVAKLNEQQQADVARVLSMWLDGEPHSIVPLSSYEREAVQAGLNAADAGDFVNEDEMQKFWHRHSE